MTILPPAGSGIAVVGAGIGGLTAALALHRAGRQVEVFEQAAAIGEVGAGIQVAPNAGRLLRRLGLGAALDEFGVRPRAIELRAWNTGQVLDRVGLDGDFADTYGAPYYTIHRADLHGALLGALPVDTVRLGARCVGFEHEGGGVVARFRDGGQVRADLLVGADGIRSVLRQVIVADRPRFSGQVIFRGLVSADGVRWLGREARIIIWRGLDRHVVCYPISGGRLVNVAATMPARWGVESWTEPGDIDDLLAAYRGWCGPVRALLGLQGDVTRWALHDRDPVSRWGTGRVTLLGDAAHPMLPFAAQGANQAIEDAVALATAVRETGDVVAAVRRYERIRRQRTAEVQRLSRGRVGLPDPGRMYGYDAESAVARAVLRHSA